MAPPVRLSFSEPAGGWEAFQALKPEGILNASGEVLPEVDGTAFLTLISQGGNPNHPHRAAIQAGVWGILQRFTERLDPLTLRIARQAAEASGLFEPPRTPPLERRVSPDAEAPRGQGLQLEGSLKPPRTRKSKGGTSLWEGGMEQAGPSFLLREKRALLTSDRQQVVWEVEIDGEVDCATWQKFVEAAWDDFHRKQLPKDVKLILHFLGKGRVVGGSVTEIVSRHLTTISEVTVQHSAPPPVEPLPKPSPEELQNASERLAQVRVQEEVSGSSPDLEKPSIQRIVRLWRQFFMSQDQPPISYELWLRLADRLAKKIVRHLPALSEISLVAMAQRVYEDIKGVEQHFAGRGEWTVQPVVLGLIKLSSAQMNDLFSRYHVTWVLHALTAANPFKAIARYERNFRAAVASLQETEYASFARTIAHDVSVLAAVDEEEAYKKALEQAPKTMAVYERKLAVARGDVEGEQQAQDRQTAREELAQARKGTSSGNARFGERWVSPERAQENIEARWDICYRRSMSGTEFPQKWWIVAKTLLAGRVAFYRFAFYADKSRMTLPVLDQMAEMIFEELEALRRVYPSDRRPPLLNHLDKFSAGELLGDIWNFIPREQAEGEQALSAEEWMNQIRSAQRRKGGYSSAQQFWQKKLVERWKGLKVEGEVPPSWWEHVAERFGWKMAGLIDFTKLATERVDQVGRALHQELLSIRADYPASENPPEVLDMIDIFPAGQILQMIKDYGRAVTSRVSRFADPIAAAERFQANRPHIEAALTAAGYGNDVIQDIIWKTKTLFEENHHSAVAKALRIAQRWKSQGGRGRTLPPPTASAGGGETNSTVTESSPYSGGEKLERGILDISRGVGGFVTITAPFVGLDVAEHYHWISPGQKTLIVTGLMGAMTYFDRMTPGHLGLLYAPFEMGRIASQQGLKAVGVRESSVWYKAGGTVGAFAAAEGFVTWVGKGAGATTLRGAHILGREVLHDSLLNIGRNIVTSIAEFMPTAAEARLLGAALATGVTSLARTLITPLILPLDALRGFPQRRGPSA